MKIRKEIKTPPTEQEKELIKRNGQNIDNKCLDCGTPLYYFNQCDDCYSKMIGQARATTN